MPSPPRRRGLHRGGPPVVQGLCRCRFGPILPDGNTGRSWHPAASTQCRRREWNQKARRRHRNSDPTNDPTPRQGVADRQTSRDNTKVGRTNRARWIPISSSTDTTRWTSTANTASRAGCRAKNAGCRCCGSLHLRFSTVLAICGCFASLVYSVNLSFLVSRPPDFRKTG